MLFDFSYLPLIRFSSTTFVEQAGQMAGSPVMDPTKNESLGQQLGNNETIPPEEGQA